MSQDANDDTVSVPDKFRATATDKEKWDTGIGFRIALAPVDYRDDMGSQTSIFRDAPHHRGRGPEANCFVQNASNLATRLRAVFVAM